MVPAAWRLCDFECCQQHSGTAHHSAVPPVATALCGCAAGARATSAGLHTDCRQTESPRSLCCRSGCRFPQGEIHFSPSFVLFICLSGSILGCTNAYLLYLFNFPLQLPYYVILSYITLCYIMLDYSMLCYGYIIFYHMYNYYVYCITFYHNICYYTS